jgi:hypothetical protein
MIRYNVIRNCCCRLLCACTVAAVLLFMIAASLCQAAKERPLQKKDVAEIIDTLTAAFVQHYVYPDTARALSDYIHNRLAAGEYDSITDLTSIADKLRQDMRSFTHDRHIWVSVMSEDDSPAIGDTVTDAEIASSAQTNFGIRKAEWLTGNVGYVRFDRFDDAAYAGDAAAAAMNFVARCDAVIIDLRYNGGGYETMVRFLASYFFKGPVMINALYFPETDSLEQSWTSAYVPGKKLVDVDLYILVSNMTGSGAEAFAYGMKHSGRATLIGETTAGAAHWTESWDFPSLHIRASIPIARPINPVTKTSWERTGVKPDIDVPSSQALVVAHRDAVKRLLGRATDEELRSKLTWALAGLEAQAEPVSLTPETMQTYTGEFAGGRYAILTRENNLLMRYSDGVEYVLVPLSEDLFGFEDTDDYRVEFVRDDNGMVSGFRILALGKEPGPIRERTGDLK